jgi:Group XII secretory phospholipase A2 precursor (PLA2G12)
VELPFFTSESSSISPEALPEGCLSSPLSFAALTKLTASEIPRRTVLRLVAGSLAATALSRFGIRMANAQSTCLCAGQPYNPETECCTSIGVQPKNRITNLAACPGRVPHPGHIPDFDGCGSSKTSPILYPVTPNSWGLADFEPCCNNHDICYDTCNNVKSDCDGTFIGCLSDACLVYLPLVEIAPELFASCVAVADVYYLAVAFRGNTAFDASQEGACDCCADTTCAQSCAGSVCGSLPACAPGGDCVCFTSTEGDGACIHGATPCSAVSSCSSTADCPGGTTCVATSCCGSFGVCGPLCNPILPAAVRSAVVAPGTLTLGGYVN